MDFDEVRPLVWRDILAQLPQEVFDPLFGTGGGVTKVAFIVTGCMGYWWARGPNRQPAIDVDLVVWSLRLGRLHLHPDSSGRSLEWSVQSSYEPFAPAGAGEGVQAGRRQGPRQGGFLHGGSGDAAFLARMSERTPLDEGVEWWPRPLWLPEVPGFQSRSMKLHLFQPPCHFEHQRHQHDPSFILI